jgi:hypothetical protein
LAANPVSGRAQFFDSHFEPSLGSLTANCRGMMNIRETVEIEAKQLESHDHRTTSANAWRAAI